jgi:hypothetical protein
MEEVPVMEVLVFISIFLRKQRYFAFSFRAKRERTKIIEEYGP